MLTDTPVESNLVELYNLITVLKPGLLATEAEFRKEFLLPGKPKSPRNPERLRALLGEVMVRNTRSVADVGLPPRIAARLIRKKEERQPAFDWNPVLGVLESPLRESCADPAYPLNLCERLHLLCRNCWAAMPCLLPFLLRGVPAALQMRWREKRVKHRIPAHATVKRGTGASACQPPRCRHGTKLTAFERGHVSC